MNHVSHPTRNHLIRMTAVALAFGLAVTAGATYRTDAAARQSDTDEAIASLAPVGAASGWGRVKLENEQRAGAIHREAEIMLFGLEPQALFNVQVDGVQLIAVRSDAFGDATAKLGSSDDSRPPVPSDVPEAASAQSATVTDDTGAFVLEGTFRGSSSGDDDGPGSSSIHEERISLADVAGLGAAGIAKVERNVDGSQEFETRATGLEPGSSYRITVDGLLAGATTADAVGQASLELEHPDDSNPLPDTLQPVEALRLVEWTRADGLLVLSGSFTGASNDDDGGLDDGDGSFEGFVTALGDAGFTLLVGGAELEVVITPTTVFEDVAGLGSLVIGDAVEVHGALAGTVLTATRVERRGELDDDGDDDWGHGETSIEASIVALWADGFDLGSPGGSIAVDVSNTTVWEDVSGLTGLAIGDFVEVEGVWDGDTLHAMRVELKNGDDSNDDNGDDDSNDDSGDDDSGDDSNDDDDNDDDDDNGGDDDDDNGGN